MKKINIIDDEDKGREIRFCHGEYHGKYGWIDNSYPEDSCATQIHVIVFIKTVNSRRLGNVDKGYYTRVEKGNIESIRRASCYDEAVLFQDQKTEKSITNLARRLATMGISTRNTIMIWQTALMKRMRTTMGRSVGTLSTMDLMIHALRKKKCVRGWPTWTTPTWMRPIMCELVNGETSRSILLLLTFALIRFHCCCCRLFFSFPFPTFHSFLGHLSQQSLSLLIQVIHILSVADFLVDSLFEFFHR